MAWKIESAQDDTAWTHEYLAEVLARPCAGCLPPKARKVGRAEVRWFEIEPRIAWVYARGGTPEDNWLAEQIVTADLAEHGIERAEFTFDAQHKTADWNDIMAKAKRLIQSGQVQLLRNGPNNVVAHVVGDHGEYTCEIGRDDPNSRAITSWQCECPWDQFAWQRTRKWKKYEGRPCAHVLAAYWQGLATPLDEQGPVTPGQKPFQPQVPGDIPGVPYQPQLPVPEQSLVNMPQQPLTESPAQPAKPDVLPPPPGEQMQLVPPGTLPVGVSPPPGVTVSEPGARPPNPFNPVQSPGVYSKTAAEEYQNGDMVRLEEAEYGVMEGKSELHGAGQYKEIPKGSIGEVLGQDPTTGWVDVIFAGPQADAGPMEPFHVRAFLEPEKLTAMPNIKKPGPFIQRG